MARRDHHKTNLTGQAPPFSAGEKNENPLSCNHMAKGHDPKKGGFTMSKKMISTLLAILLITLCLPTFAQTLPDAEPALLSVQLTQVPKVGETKTVQGTVYLKDLDPADYIIIAVVGEKWPKPYYDSYRNKLTASGDAGYATFSFSVTTGGQDTSYNTFTLYLCKASLFDGVGGSSITDSYLKTRYIEKMVVDKTEFNAQAEQPQPTPTMEPAPTDAAYVFPIYDDALLHYGDIAYMGSKSNGNDGSMTIDTDCADNPHSGSQCILITYTPPYSNHWAGMMWLSGAGNFPPNLPVDGVDTAQASQLTFYVRGDGSTKFFIENDKKQQVTRSVQLTPDWTQYTLAFPSSWSQVCVGFGFASSGSAGKSTIYLDDIVFSK